MSTHVALFGLKTISTSAGLVLVLTCFRSYYVIMLSLVLARMSCVSLRGFLFIFIMFASLSSGVWALGLGILFQGRRGSIPQRDWRTGYAMDETVSRRALHFP